MLTTNQVRSKIDGKHENDYDLFFRIQLMEIYLKFKFIFLDR